MNSFGSPDIYDQGYDKNLVKTPQSGAVLPALDTGAGSTSLIPDTMQGPATSSPVTASVPAEQLMSGDHSTIFFSGKGTFDDTSPGFRMGIDPVDGQFKWLMGSPNASINYSVTSPGVFYINLPAASSVSNAIFINDDSTSIYPAVDIRRSATSGGNGAGIYIQLGLGAGYGIDVVQNSDTGGVHIVTTNTGSNTIPLKLENVAATSTNFYRQIEYSFEDVPATTILRHWIANNASPNGTLTGKKGDLCQSSNGNLYINTDGSTTWVSVLTSATSLVPVETLAVANFDASGRYSSANGGTGTTTFGSGVLINAGSDYATVDWVYVGGGTSGSGYSNNPQIAIQLTLSEALADNNAIAYVGLGAPTTDATGITLSQAHVGFKIVRESGVNNLYGTQGDGTEATTSVLTTVVNGDSLELVCKITSGSSASYYWSKNHGAMSSASVVSTHLPSSATNSTNMRFACSAASTATPTKITVYQASYRRS